jgi:Fe-S oxidoreductase
VLLWPDTFNDHFFPRTARNAVEVLEAAGCQVELPPDGLCCGRPLYDWGMLDLAKRQLRAILTALRDDIRAGVPLVVLEPSCAVVFRDELLGLFPDDEDAQRLAGQTLLLSEFLARRGDAYAPPRLHGRALVQPHCHQHAVMGTDADRRLLERMGLEVTMLDGGCCGMAGSFGFEARHYDVSMAVGEHAVLPAVRAASSDTLIIADGFSCREQLTQGAGRQPLHLADVLRLALGGPGAEQAARAASVDGHHPHAVSTTVMVAAVAAATVGAMVALKRQRA